jgi:hypothetical protein
MAVFRIEKTKNYTVMSNHHLRNETLSLKAKGLLSQMLSLPKNWDYTLKGLSHINRESIEAIRTAVLELEKAGYIVRRQKRDEKGKMSNIEYTIYEQPKQSTNPDKQPIPPSCDFSITEKPTSGKPITEKPVSEFPKSENPTQLSKVKIKKEKLNTQNTESYPIPSALAPTAFDAYREIIRDNIEYDYLLENHNHDIINEIIDLLLEIVCTSRKTIRIASDDYPAALVKSKFLKLNNDHIEYVLQCMKNNTSDIRNIKKYLLAVLFNAPSTIVNYYSALVSHDMASGKFATGGKSNGK